jgi:hypothetical protein
MPFLVAAEVLMAALASMANTPLFKNICFGSPIHKGCSQVLTAGFNVTLTPLISDFGAWAFKREHAVR